MDILEPKMSNRLIAGRRGSYAKLMRKGSLVLDIRHASSLKESTSSLSNSTGSLAKMEDSNSANGSPKSPLANSSNSVVMNGELKTRMFKAIQGIEFPGVGMAFEEPIPPPNELAPFAKIPVFLGPDGTLYDVNYIQVTEYTPPDANSSDPVAKLAFTPGSHVYSNFPEVDSFENFFDYEQAVMDWKDSVLKNLGWLQLPTVLGRFYSRPKMMSESRVRRDSTTSSDSASFQDLLDDKGYVDSPPIETRMHSSHSISLESFEFGNSPSPIRESMLDSGISSGSGSGSGLGSASIHLDTELDNEYGEGFRRQLSEIGDSGEYSLQHYTKGGHLDDEVPKSPRMHFRKSQSFSRAGSPGGPHRKLTHRISDPDNLRAEGYEETRWMYSRDPWESSLVPPEPVPAFYATFDEYESAMRRWAKECITKMSYMPPHALQLQDIIKLSPAMEQLPERVTAAEAVPVGSEQEHPARKVKSGENSYEQLFEPFIKRPPSPPPEVALPPPHTPGEPPLVTLSASALRKFVECLDNLNRNIDQEQLVRRFDIMPIFVPNWKQSVQNKITAHSIPALPLKAARRTDIFSELDMSPLQKEYPEPEPVFNFTKLVPGRHFDAKYAAQAKQTVRQLDSVFRFDHLYSTYTTTNPKDIVQLRAEIHNNISGPLSVDTVKKVVMSRMYVDKFKDFLGETVPNSYDDSTFLNVFMDQLNGDNLRQILDLLDHSSEDSVKAKVSVLLSSILSTQRGHTWVALVIESYVDHEDLESLYKFALAASFLTPKPLDIYPYRPNLHAPIVRKVFQNGPVQTIVVQVYLYYYLGIITKLSSHPDIVEWLQAKRKEVSDQMAEGIQKDKIFLISDLFKGIAHRSSTLSNHFLFIVAQLLHCYDLAIQKVLRSPDVGLVAGVRNLATSKFVHSQYAARRLFETLLADPWRDFLLTEIDKSKTFFDDLTSPTRNGEAPSLLSTLMLSVVESAMANIPTEKNQLKNYPGAFLLSDDLFHTALNSITKTKIFDARLETVSLFLETVSKALFIHGLAEASDKLKTTTKTRMERAQESVQISLADIQQITTFIHKVTANDKYSVRTSMLNCLRHLLKHSRTFDFLKKETHIHLRLINFCKDGKNMVFNRTAWKLFYQLIHYHKESLDQFEKSKVLAQFLDILGTNSGNTIMLNSLHYTYKIFSILDREAERAKSGKAVSRAGDAKSLEKDLKTLSRIFVQSHLFIKIHMIYKRLMGQQQGASFIQLAQLYYIIGRNPLCKKLCKDIQRNSEYKDGLIKICSMFEPPHSTTPVPNLATV